MTANVKADPSRYDQKLELILRASARIFAEKSYHSTSMRDISRATGISLAGLYHYCKSKEELLFLIQDHCFGRVLQRLEERLQSESDPIARLRIFIDNHLSFFAANMAEMKVLSHEAESLGGDLHEHVSTRKRQYTRTAYKMLSEVRQAAVGAQRTTRRNGATSKTARPVEVTVATYALFGMMNWIYTWYQPKRDLPLPLLMEQMLRIYFFGVLQGTAVEAPWFNSTSGTPSKDTFSLWRNNQ